MALRFPVQQDRARRDLRLPVTLDAREHATSTQQSYGQMAQRFPVEQSTILGNPRSQSKGEVKNSYFF